MDPPGLPACPSLATASGTSSGERDRDSPSARSSTVTAPRSPIEHTYSLLDSRNTPYATLKVNSYAASPRFLPSYYEGQPITGRVLLNLAKPESIVSVSLILSGTIVATNNTQFCFWEHTTPLWSSNMGDPRALPLPGQPKSTSKLLGAYEWPFSVALPSSCTVATKKNQPPTSMRMPPSFSEKGASQFINYEMNVRIRRGPLRIDSKLGTHFGYMPRIRPPQPSALRRLAYTDNRLPPGPATDPSGWDTLPPIPIKGTVFGVRAVEATCTLSIALPLAYTRGCAIPCALAVECADAQALDLLCMPAAPSVHLLREVRYGVAAVPVKTKPGLAMDQATTLVASASWWPAPAPGGTPGAAGAHRRVLDGEIPLPKDIPPSFEFAKFSMKVKYFLVLMPFEATAFAPAATAPALLRTVDICTLYAHGPKPRAYAPPGTPPHAQSSLVRKVIWGLHSSSFT